MRKNSTLIKIQVFGVFEAGKPGLLPTALKFDIKFHSKPFFFYLKSIYLHF